MRAGWGVVVLKQGEQRVAWRMHGSCPDLYPSVFRAELMAVLNVLRVAMPPLRIHVDNAEVVTGFQRGEEWCVAPERDGGELWREVWWRMKEMEGEVEVVKAKAHTEEEEVGEGVITERDRFGNLHADAEARRGARLAESLAPVGTARTEFLKAVRWLGWVRRFAAVWRADAREEEEERGEEGRRVEEPARPKQGAGLRHLVWERGVALTCRRCGRVADTEQKRRDLRSSRCQGSAVGRLLKRTCNDPEAVSRACVKRRQDLLSRGWRPKKGGGDDEGSIIELGDQEFDEEGNEHSASEGVAHGEREEMVATPMEEEGRRWRGVGAAAEPAAAASRSSAGASAAAGGEGRDYLPTRVARREGERSPRRGKEGEKLRADEVVVRSLEDGHVEDKVDAMVLSEWYENLPDLPELPEAEALAVMERRGKRPRGPRWTHGDGESASKKSALSEPEAGRGSSQQVGPPAGAQRGRKRRLDLNSAARSAFKERRMGSPSREEAEVGVQRLGEEHVMDKRDAVMMDELHEDLPDPPEFPKVEVSVARGKRRMRPCGTRTALPELPESEAVAVLAQLGMQRSGPQRLGGGTGVALSSGAPHGRESPGSPKGKGRGAGMATPPASKKPRRDASPMGDEDRMGPVAAADEAWAMLEAHGPCDEDPFGHIEAELAAAGSTARPGMALARMELEARGGQADGSRNVEDSAVQPLTPRQRAKASDAAEGAEVPAIAFALTRDEESQREDKDELVGIARTEREERRRRLDLPGPERRPAAFGRRYTGVVSDPVDSADSSGHLLRISGPIIFCDRCGRYATRRVGKALKAGCGGLAQGAYATRLARLRTGHHPISGESLL